MIIEKDCLYAELCFRKKMIPIPLFFNVITSKVMSISRASTLRPGDNIVISYYISGYWWGERREFILYLIRFLIPRMRLKTFNR